jgi:Bacteriophage lambda head decoration protein D
MTVINKKPGIAGFASEQFTEEALITGDAPITTTSETLVSQGAVLPAYSVVGRVTASGKITLSNPGAADGSQAPIGITCNEAPNTGADQGIAIYRGGCFNPDRLNYHAGFNTDALKRLAFEAKQPTILIRKIG